jgi:hypothetical protein
LQFSFAVPGFNLEARFGLLPGHLPGAIAGFRRWPTTANQKIQIRPQQSERRFDPDQPQSSGQIKFGGIYGTFSVSSW